jgi:hypothetical protein
MFNDFSPVFSEMPMEDNGDSMFYDYEQVKLLPSTGWRAFNTAWTESGVTTPYREYLKVLGGEIKWDVQFANEKTITRQTEMKVLSASRPGTPFSRALRSRMSTRWWACEPASAATSLIQNASGGGTLTLAKLSSLDRRGAVLDRKSRA